MANSITLSQSLVDDIAQKLTDGTATAEQVVLYTKGLNQLQTGNDFQSVVIGLSQAAVDTIDAANAQFQEDSTAALATFSQTSTNINTSATNAVAAINVAKDTLVATEAGIATTISGVPSEAKISSLIVNQDLKDYRTEGAKGWTGPHALPFEFQPMNPSYRSYSIDHPYKSPCFLNYVRQGYSTHDGIVQLVNHELQVIDEVWMDHNNVPVANWYQYNHGQMPGTRWDNWNLVHDYFTRVETLAGSGDNNIPYMTGYSDQNGNGRHIHHPEAYLGLRSGAFGMSSNITGSNDQATYGGSTCSIVGTSHSDFTIAQPGNESKIYFSASKDSKHAMYSRMNRPNRTAESDYWQTNHAGSEFATWGKFEDKNDSTAKYPGDILYHDRLQFPGSYGKGNASLNMNTNKFAYIETEAGGNGYNWNIKLYTNNTDKKIRDIALGRVLVSTYDADPTSEGILTMEIDSALDFKTASQTDNTTTNYTTEDRYYGKVVLCDNDTVIAGTVYVGGASQVGQAIRRMTKNAAGTEYEYDTQIWNAGSTCYMSEYGGQGVVTSNDGKYAVMYHSYYYYGAGIMGAIIRVSDGAMLQFRKTETSHGFEVVPIKNDKFIFKMQYRSDQYNFQFADCGHLFANYTDTTDITNKIFGTDDYQEYDFSKGIRRFMMNNTMYNRNTGFLNIYNPYKYMFEFYNTDGTRKAIYDENYNLI